MLHPIFLSIKHTPEDEEEGMAVEETETDMKAYIR